MGSKEADIPPMQGGVATLGALLYSDPGQPLVDESSWLDLVRRIAARDALALDALYQRAHRIVFTLVMRIVNDRQASDEVTLDVFHDAWRQAAHYDPNNGSVLGWIMNRARSRALDRLRFSQRKKRVAPAFGAGAREDGRDFTNDSDRVLEGNRLRQALTILTVGEREAIESAYFGERTYAEVAARLDEPLGTIKTRIRSGLVKLRRALLDHEGDP